MCQLRQILRGCRRGLLGRIPPNEALFQLLAFLRSYVFGLDQPIPLGKFAFENPLWRVIKSQWPKWDGHPGKEQERHGYGGTTRQNRNAGQRTAHGEANRPLDRG